MDGTYIGDDRVGRWVGWKVDMNGSGGTMSEMGQWVMF